MEYPDNELTYYLHDNNEEARDLLYEKYKYIIDVLFAKYKRVFYALNIDFEEVRQEANLAFSNALYSYDEKKDTSLSTFITMCVERKIRGVIKKYETSKNKILSESISLYDDSLSFMSLEETIADNTYEPSKMIEEADTLKYINSELNKVLSSNELEVFKLMLEGMDYVEIANVLNKTTKQIDNTIQRIRIKLKKLK
ncbi:MAG: sigma-70 family RNA polymerase sigma factor [Bacilli bacterium]|nr:sigma-70 family RNA polymerase sigma factor [Bacilli bacterium]